MERIILNKNAQHFINRVNEKYGKGVYTFDKLDYINAHTKVKLFCVSGQHYFTIAPMHMVSKSSKGCNKCQKNTAYTTEEFVEKISKLYPTLTFEKTVYKTQRSGNVIVTCHADPTDVHDWEVAAHTLIKGKTQCGICSGKSGRTPEQFVKEARKVHGDKYNYPHPYKNSMKNIDIECPIDGHGIFSQSPKAHLAGRGCPKCGKYGYQPSQPGYFYVQKLESDDKVLYKYGITGDMDRRITEQSRNSVFNHTILVERYFEDGKKPLVLEKFLKTYIESGVATPDELQSGFTETFDAKYLEVVLEIVNNFK